MCSLLLTKSTLGGRFIVPCPLKSILSSTNSGSIKSSVLPSTSSSRSITTPKCGITSKISSNSIRLIGGSRPYSTEKPVKGDNRKEPIWTPGVEYRRLNNPGGGKVDDFGNYTTAEGINMPTQSSGGLTKRNNEDFTSLDIFEGKGAAIDAYSHEGFVVQDNYTKGSILSFPNKFWAWNVSKLEDITIEKLAPIWLHNPTPRILVLGTGYHLMRPAPEIIKFLLVRGISLEVLTTPTAISTYNFLLQEDRMVAGAFLPAGKEPETAKKTTPSSLGLVAPGFATPGALVIAPHSNYLSKIPNLMKLSGQLSQASLHDRTGLALEISNCYFKNTHEQYLLECSEFTSEVNGVVDYVLCAQRKIVSAEHFRVFNLFLNHLDDMTWFHKHEYHQHHNLATFSQSLVDLQATLKLQKESLKFQLESKQIISDFHQVALPELISLMNAAEPVIQSVEYVNYMVDEYFDLLWDIKYSGWMMNQKSTSAALLLTSFILLLCLLFFRIPIVPGALLFTVIVLLRSSNILSLLWAIKLVVAALVGCWVLQRQIPSN